jgi:hypothetical protein
MKNTAIFVLSTGRCGTQWLARFFELNLGDAATVSHEPIHSDWSPREMLGAKTPANLPPGLREPIEEHVQWIRGTLSRTMYIECGHPSWSSIRYLVDTFEPHVRVIHLIRHPVPTAWSWVTHRVFCEPLLPHIPEKVLLSPFDEGVQFPQYRDRWNGMSPYEKALYYWLEVNTFAKRTQSEVGIEWLTLSFQELFDSASQKRVLAFAGAASESPKNPGVVDELQSVSEVAVKPTEIANHPPVLRLAGDFGFDALQFDVEQLRRRYFRAALPAFRR